MGDHISFRPAQSEDFEAVLELAGQLAVHIEAEKPPLSFQQFEAHYLNAGAAMRLLLAVVQDRVVGMISWTLTHELHSADTRVYISDLAVDKSVRGQGVGAGLMREVVIWAAANGADKLGWDVWRHNEVAKAFYESRGGRLDDEALPYVLSVKDARA